MSLSDDDRIKGRRSVARLGDWVWFEGPLERAPCGKHPDAHVGERLLWRVPATESASIDAHREAILDAFRRLVGMCQACHEEAFR